MSCSGSGIFKSEHPVLLAKAVVEAVTHCQDANRLAIICTGLGKPMAGESLQKAGDIRTATRGY